MQPVIISLLILAAFSKCHVSANATNNLFGYNMQSKITEVIEFEISSVSPGLNAFIAPVSAASSGWHNRWLCRSTFRVLQVQAVEQRQLM